MKAEEFKRLQEQCKPTTDSYNPQTEPAGYYPLSFARAILPKMNPFNLKYLKVYDGAELFKGAATDDTKILKIKAEETPYSVSLFTYPKGVLAEKLKSKLQVGQSEISVLAEVSQDDKIEVYFRINEKVRQFFSDSFKAKKLPDISKTIDKRAFNSDIQTLKKHFNKTISHSNLITFIGKTIGVNFDEVVLKVKISSIKAQTSEPADNGNRQVKDKQQKYIITDFEIQNQSATNYSIHVYKGKEKIHEQVYLPEMTVTASRDKQNPQARKTNTTVEQPVHQPGKHQAVWDCTDNGVFDERDVKQKLTIKIQATGVAKQIAIAQKDISIKETVDNADANNFIAVTVSGAELNVYKNDIIQRHQAFRNKVPQHIYDTLSDEGKLILNLPTIMAKLGFLHGALCQIHWLEGSRASLKFPYEFFMSEKRVENVDVKNLEEYFKELRYLSLDNLGYTPSNPDGVNLFLYNDNIPSIKSALELFNRNLSERTEGGEIGNYNNLATERNEEVIVKENLFQSFSMGSAFGNIDDVGIALGMYAQRCYFKAFISKNQDTNKWILSIDEVACRFFDDFSFNDNLIDLGPIEYSQPLGCWHPEIDKPKMPHYTKIHKPDGLTVCLQNRDYQELKKSLSQSLPQSCNDFFIYSDLKILNYDFLQKDIVIF